MGYDPIFSPIFFNLNEGKTLVDELGVALAGLNVLDQSSMCQVGYPTTKQA
jgi:hypothetical protein